MQIRYGDDQVTRNIQDLFGQDRVDIVTVLEHFAETWGFDTAQVEAHIDGAMVAAGTQVSDTCVINILPKANKKG